MSYKQEIRRLEKEQLRHNSSIIHTYILIAILIAMYCYQFFILGDGVASYITHTQDIFNGTFYTLFTALFFHSGIVHLAGNLLGLFLFGRIVEKHVGFKLYFIFLMGGVLANLISNIVATFLGQSYASLGASSGIASIIIFAMLLEPFRFTTLLGWFLISLDVSGVQNPQSQTNHLAHLAGYFSLLVLYFFIEKHHKKKVISGIIINGAIIVLVYSLLKLNGLFF